VRYLPLHSQTSSTPPKTTSSSGSLSSDASPVLPLVLASDRLAFTLQFGLGVRQRRLKLIHPGREVSLGSRHLIGFDPAVLSRLGHIRHLLEHGALFRLRGFDLRVQFPDLLLQSRRPPVAPAQPDQASRQRDRSDYPCYVA